MVEIRYSESYEVADLAGQSVACAREQFKAEFCIPSNAAARLNGKKVKGKMEAETCLNDSDRLTFAKARGKAALLLGAVLLSLVITGGVFAYTATTTTSTIGIVAENDFVSVSENQTGDIATGTWSVFGKYKGTLPTGNIYTIYPANNYTGDLVATLFFGDADDMIKAYRVFVMKLEVTDNASGSVDTGILTMSKGEVELAIDTSASPSDYYQVKSNGGFYVSPLWAGFTPPTDADASPLLYIDVVQR